MNGLELAIPLACIGGAFHQTSERHLNRFIEKMEWRFNNPRMFLDTVKRILKTRSAAPPRTVRSAGRLKLGSSVSGSSRLLRLEQSRCL